MTIKLIQDKQLCKKIIFTFLFISAIATTNNIFSRSIYADSEERLNKMVVSYDADDTFGKLDDDITVSKTNKEKMAFQSILNEEERIRKAEEERIRAEQERIRILNERLDKQRSLLGQLGGGYNDGNSEAGLLDDRILGAITFAKNQIGKPYIWGATGSRGYDCSGLTMMAYESVGIDIGRTTYNQIYAGRGVSSRDLKPGDLILFNYDGTPSHVGLYIGNGNMIHAPQTGESIKVAPVNYSRICGIRRVV